MGHLLSLKPLTKALKLIFFHYGALFFFKLPHQNTVLQSNAFVGCFSPPDCTVGFGISPNRPPTLFHPLFQSLLRALKNAKDRFGSRALHQKSEFSALTAGQGIAPCPKTIQFFCFRRCSVFLRRIRTRPQKTKPPTKEILYTFRRICQPGSFMLGF